MHVPLLVLSDEPDWLEAEVRRVVPGNDLTWSVLGGTELVPPDTDVVVVATDDLAHPGLLGLLWSLRARIDLRHCLLLNLGRSRDTRPLFEALPGRVLHLHAEVALLPSVLRAVVRTTVLDDLTTWIAPDLAPALRVALVKALQRSGDLRGPPPPPTGVELAVLARVGRSNLSYQAGKVGVDLPALLKLARIRWILGRGTIGRTAPEIAKELGYRSVEPVRRLLKNTIGVSLSGIGHVDPSEVDPEIRATLGGALGSA